MGGIYLQTRAAQVVGPLTRPLCPHVALQSLLRPFAMLAPRQHSAISALRRSKIRQFARRFPPLM